jgi:hypothetical protein
MVIPILNRLLRWRRPATRQRFSAGDPLPGWALGDLSLSSAQLSWLHRSVLSWHAVPLKRETPISDTGWPLARIAQWLAQDGIELHACRVTGLRSIERGDVLMLRDADALRLFGSVAVGGGGMALVIDAGPERLRLSPALASGPSSWRGRDIAPALVGWVLRSRYVGHTATRPRLLEDELVSTL